MLTTDLLTVGEVAHRSGFAPSALRFYEREGLVHATRTSGGQRRYQRNVLRRLAFIRAARNIGLTLDEVAAALATLPDGRTPTKEDWSRLSRGWRKRLDDQIASCPSSCGSRPRPRSGRQALDDLRGRETGEQRRR
jgi:MerR family redox-sensitive transcriptional activator SoxR